MLTSWLKTAEKPPRANERALWENWQQSGRNPAELRPLLSSLAPLVQRTVNTYRAADISPQALKAQAQNQLIRGLETYKPSKGSLSTHLNWQMRGVGRFVERYQNFARIPGSRIRYIGRFQAAQRELAEGSGGAPTLTEIAKKARIPRGQAEKLTQELHPVHILGLEPQSGEGPLRSDAGDYSFNPDRERIELIYPDLSPVEQLVVDYSLGRNGKATVKSTAKLAKILGVSSARVSNARSSIAKKTRSLSWIR